MKGIKEKGRKVFCPGCGKKVSSVETEYRVLDSLELRCPECGKVAKRVHRGCGGEILEKSGEAVCRKCGKVVGTIYRGPRQLTRRSQGRRI